MRRSPSPVFATAAPGESPRDAAAETVMFTGGYVEAEPVPAPAD